MGATSTMVGNDAATESTETTTILSRDAILGADESDLLECVDVPEWGGAVYIRVMSGSERDALESEMTGEKKNLINFRARFAVKILADENGNRIFKDADAEILGKKSALALDRILKIGMEINGFTETEIDKLEKN